VGVLPFLLGWMGGGLATRGYAQVRDGGETKTNVASVPKKGSSANCEITKVHKMTTSFGCVTAVIRKVNDISATYA